MPIPFLSAIPGAIASRVTYEIVKASGGSQAEAFTAAAFVGGVVSIAMLDPVGGAATHAVTHAGTHAVTHAGTHATTHAGTHAVTHAGTHATTHAGTQVTSKDVIEQLGATAVYASMPVNQIKKSSLEALQQYELNQA